MPVVSAAWSPPSVSPFSSRWRKCSTAPLRAWIGGGTVCGTKRPDSRLPSVLAACSEKHAQLAT